MVVRVIVVDLGAGQWWKKLSFWSCWEKKCRGYIDADVTDSMIDQCGQYQVFRCDRLDRMGGGVCIMIDRAIKCIRLVLSGADQSLLIKSGCDLICLDLLNSNTKYRFILTYRPPNLPDLIPATIALRDLLCNLSATNVTSFILGDFNLPSIDWSNNFAKPDGVHNVLLEFFNDIGLDTICS